MKPQAWLVAGLAWGDEGKGTTVEYLVRRHSVPLVVRYNGGAQAGHTVVLADGRTHTFAQWGSGTLAGAATYVGPRVIIDPLAALNEAEGLKKLGVGDPWAMIQFDPKCPIVTPWHRAANRLREQARGDKAHGSCGRGIGEVAGDICAGHEVVRAKDLDRASPRTFKLVLEATMEHKREQLRKDLGSDALTYFPTNVDAVAYRLHQWAVLAQISRPIVWSHKKVLFEGAQGALLDQDFGYCPPHVTWSDCTFQWATDMMDVEDEWEVTKVGVCRSYMTRHGAGPFPTEDESMDLPEPHNDPNNNSQSKFQGKFRMGSMDFNLLRRGIQILDGVDYLSVTHLDRVYVPTAQIARELGVPIGVTSYGPTYEDKVSYDGL